MKLIWSAIILGVVIVGAVLYITRGGVVDTKNNVSIVEGKQVIQIIAKGGYSPRNSVAKAGMPTVLKIKTSGTFDCSSALVIPSLSYRANLPMSGETLIDVPTQPVGSTLQGICAMGMYSFSVQFN
ncbi:MAG: hypothetical protein A3I32_02085 [Candidatus Yanofskybacteria bacterium RIFCSPLOWO2_02_FULL_45_10]|uniref:EfeO-type cupredoxin-like domain-containing protein n=1 Tax=Candidatus Yanofskybacteria bacterium RIFCSPLOWO2_02_FULL_45_10 TaxID=1802706 RepID=A0A1F8H2N8_9BACT|nr:MAG: hypothetical protein A3I32_02085 [Candidatus Yanofskybacteria bacterium RIFCSPLOWO2_02_FULL_45_10]